VVRSLAQERKGVLRLKEVKTKSSRRRIKFTPATMVALNAHRKQMLRAGL